jgi:hypothetical protein
MNNDNKKKPTITKANMKLQMKVGKGPLDENTVKPAQNVIDKNDVDFGPLGLEILKKLENALLAASDPSISMDKVKAILTAPVMELKANAAIFKYGLIGNLANIMLHFLETIVSLDSDAVDIVRAHHKTLQMIVVRKMAGDGGDTGKMLTAELQGVCDRYYNKKFGRT